MSPVLATLGPPPRSERNPGGLFMPVLARLANSRRGLAAVLLVVLLLLAVGLRLPHLQWGLPDIEEEALPTKKAFTMWGWDTGQLALDPGTAGWPSLSFYVQLAVQGVQRAAGTITGRYDDPFDFYVEYQLDPTAVITWARAFSVLLSLVLVVVAVRIGARLGGMFTAALAGLLVAVSPMMVRHAQMVEPDLLLSVFAAFAMLTMLDLLERGRVRDYVLVAVFAGLGAASKYTPALLTLSLYATHLVRLRREGRSLAWLGFDDRRLGWAALASVLAFCVGSPYTFADLDILRRDIAYQLMHMSEGHFGHTDQGVGYVHYAFTVLPRALGWPAWIAACAGLVIAARRRDTAIALLWCFVPYFVVLGSMSTHFDRYMMPLILPLAVFAALGLDALRRRWPLTRDHGAPIMLVAILLIASQPFANTLRYHRIQGATSTQRQAAEWITAHLPSDSTTLVTERYGPHLQPDLRETTQKDPVFAKLSPEQQQRLLTRPYQKFQILPMYSTRVHLTGYYYDLRHFLAYDAIIVSGSVRNRYQKEPARFPRQNQFYADLATYCEEAARFDPGHDARGPQIVVYRWREGGAQELLDARGSLKVSHYREFVDDVHAPDFLGFVEGVAVHAEQEEQWAVASTYYAILMQTAPPENRPWYAERAGITAISAGQLDNAQTMFDWMLARDPRAVVALGNMGLIAERRGDRDAARSWYERCIEADREGSATRWAEQRLRLLDVREDQRR